MHCLDTFWYNAVYFRNYTYMPCLEGIFPIILVLKNVPRLGCYSSYCTVNYCFVSYQLHSQP